MVERQEAQVMVGKEKMVVSKERVVMGNEMVGKVGKERAGRGELSKAMRGEHGRDLKRLRLGQEQERRCPIIINVTLYDQILIVIIIR